MENAGTDAVELALKAPGGTAPDWYERIEKAKAARLLGIQLQAARKSEPEPELRQQLTPQWSTGDGRG